jgi:hypothetical protein
MGLLDEQLSEEERFQRALATIEAAQREKDYTFGQSEPPQMLPSQYNPQESNIRGKAQGQYNQEVLKKQAQLLDEDKFNKMLRKEESFTDSLDMLVSNLKGRPGRPRARSGPSRRGTTSTKPDVDAVDIEKELAWDEWLHNPGETMDDLVLFTKRKNLSGDTFKYLADRFAAFDKGKKIPMYRWNEANKNYDTIFRREGDDLEKEREVGYRVNRGDIDASRAATSDVEISGALTKARELFLSGNLKTNKDFQSFIKNNGITNHKVVAALQSAYSNLISEDDMVAMYDKEGNAVYVKLKDQAKMMEPEHGYTLPDEFKVGQNRRVNEIIAGYMTDPALSVNEVKEGVLAQVSTEKLSVDLKDTMDAVEKAYGQAEKTRVQDAGDTQQVLEAMDGFTNFGDMYQFFADNEIGSATIDAMTDKIEQANPDWKYPTTMPGVLYNELGVPLAINSVEEYNDAKETGYQYLNYGDAPDRPKDTFDLSKPPPGLDVTWVSAKMPDTIDDDGNLMIGETINEARYTPTGQEKRRVEEAKVISKEVLAFNGTKRMVNTIYAALNNSTSGGDLDAIKSLEKLKDPTGVIRQSDIETIQSGLGGWSDEIKKLKQSLLTGKKKFLTGWERDQLAYIAETVFEEYSNAFETFLLTRKEMYESITAPKAWTGGVLQFETVFPKKASESLYDRMTEYKWNGDKARLMDGEGNIRRIEPPTEGINTTGSAPDMLDALDAGGAKPKAEVDPTLTLMPRKRTVPSRLSP